MPPLPLRPYQIEDLAFYIHTGPRSGNLSDPGTGKTPSVCVYMDYLWHDLGVKSYFVMPKSLLQKNYDELLRFTRFTLDDLVIIDGTKEQRDEQMRGPAKVFLMGGDRFRHDWRTLKQLHPELDAVIVDEIHMLFGGNESKRTLALYAAMEELTYFLPMTGTLVDGRLDTAYPTIKIIEPRYYFDWWAFRNLHGDFNFDGKLVGWRNHARLKEIFDRHAVRRSFESVHGKEMKVILPKLCKMAPRQREVYDKFQREAVLELEDRFLNGSLPGVNVIRCRQIMAHPHNVKLPVGDGEFRTYNLLGTEELTGKDQMLIVDLADHWNSCKPFVIFAALQPEQERILHICQKFGFRVDLINGNVSASKRAKIDAAFQAGELDGIVGSPPTAAVGFNWQYSGGKEVEHVMFVSLDYKDSNFKQAYRRMMREPRKTHLRISVYEYERSIDQRIFAIVNRKSQDANLVDSTHEALQLGI